MLIKKMMVFLAVACSIPVYLFMTSGCAEMAAQVREANMIELSAGVIVAECPLALCGGNYAYLDNCQNCRARNSFHHDEVGYVQCSRCDKNYFKLVHTCGTKISRLTILNSPWKIRKSKVQFAVGY